MATESKHRPQVYANLMAIYERAYDQLEAEAAKALERQDEGWFYLPSWRNVQMADAMLRHAQDAAYRSDARNEEKSDGR